MDRPAEKAKLWYEYRELFLTDRRIREGTDFWLAHRQELDEASVRSGVPPEYLAAVLGIRGVDRRDGGSRDVGERQARLRPRAGHPDGYHAAVGTGSDDDVSPAGRTRSASGRGAASRRGR